MRRVLLGWLLLSGSVSTHAQVNHKALFDAIELGDYQFVKLVVQMGANVNSIDEQAWTPWGKVIIKAAKLPDTSALLGAYSRVQEKATEEA